MAKKNQWELSDVLVLPEEEIYLEFVDDQDLPPAGFVAKRVSEVLEQYTLDEVFDQNGIDEQEALEILYENGFLGLPQVLNDEALEDIQEEEEDN